MPQAFWAILLGVFIIVYWGILIYICERDKGDTQIKFDY